MVRILGPPTASYLLGDEQEVVLLAALCEDVLVVEQEGVVDSHVGVGNLLLVDAHASALCHLAHLTLAGEHGGIVGEQVDSGNTSGAPAARNSAPPLPRPRKSGPARCICQ